MEQQTQNSSASDEQLRATYAEMLSSQERFEEIKHLLAQYPEIPPEADSEPSAAAAAREALNARIGEWVTPFDGLSATQTRQLRQVLVDNRQNLAVAPWKENNSY